MSDNNSSNSDIIIITNRYVNSVANALHDLLKNLNITIKLSETVDISSNNLHILLFTNNIQTMPKRYIIYQLEQLNKSSYIADNVLNNIKNSLITFDYSMINYNNYDEEIRKNVRLQNLPIQNILLDYKPDYSYDIIFFGLMNERRKKILDKLFSQKFIVAQTSDMFGDNIYEHIKKAKIVLNLHYYENALLEKVRLNEILKYNTLIISEHTNHICDDVSDYKDDVFFIDNIENNLSNMHLLINKIKDCITNFDFYKSKITETRKNTIEKIYNKSLNNLKKNLFEAKILINDTYDSNIDFNKIICINNDNNKLFNFKKYNDTTNIYILDGIMDSNRLYYMLFKQFLKTYNQFISVCDIDCIFPKNFNNIYNDIISNFINKDYDIYINFINNDDIKDITNIDLLEQYKNNNIAGFNVFSRTFVNKFIEEYEKNTDFDIYNFINGNIFNITTTNQCYFKRFI